MSSRMDEVVTMLSDLSGNLDEPIAVEATYIITTPMFIGGASQDASSISAGSVKGALRFWWRALHWDGVYAQHDSDVVAALRSLHAREAELFGSSAENGQAAGFNMVVETKVTELTTRELEINYDDPWVTYLMGLGLTRPGGQLTYERSALAPGGTLTVRCVCKNLRIKEEISEVLLLWGMVGGLGSRARKGIGSVSIQSLTDKSVPQNRDDLISALNEIVNSSLDIEPPFTAFSKKGEIQVATSSPYKAWEQLSYIAKTMQMFRGWGYSNKKDAPHKINGITANRDSYSTKRDDLKWVCNIATTEVVPNTMASSMVFGLPRSYGLNQRKYELKFEPMARKKINGTLVEDKKNKRSRRASPLFIHVHQFPDQQVLLVQSFLPAQWMPEYDVISVRNKEGRTIGEIEAQTTANWKTIKDYLALNTFAAWERINP